MKVHYSNWVSVPVLLMGGVVLAMGILLTLMTGVPNTTIFLGLLNLVVGVQLVINPVFALEADSIALYRLIGSVARRFPFQSRSEIRVDGNKLFVGNARVPIQNWYLNGSQWRAFEERIAR